MIDLEIQARIDQLYADMKPLMDKFGMKPKTIEERYQAYLQKKAAIEQIQASRPKLRFKLPKL